MPSSEVDPTQGTTCFIVEHTIPSDSKAQFLALEEQLEAAARKSKGCRSARLEELPTDEPSELHYRTTMVFDSQDSLIAWVDSDVRQQLVQATRVAFPYGYALSTRMSGFSGWFPRARKPPPGWKMNLIVLLTLYPTVLILSPLLKPITRGLDFATSMLLANICSVTVTGSVLMPLANRVYAPWINPPASPAVRVLAPLSALLILALAWALARQLLS